MKLLFILFYFIISGCSQKSVGGVEASSQYNPKQYQSGPNPDGPRNYGYKNFSELIEDCKLTTSSMFTNIENYEKSFGKLTESQKSELFDKVVASISYDSRRDSFIKDCIKKGRKNGLSQDIILKLAKQLSVNFKDYDVKELSGGDKELSEIVTNKYGGIAFSKLVEDSKLYKHSIFGNIKKYEESFGELTEGQESELFDKVLESISNTYGGRDSFIKYCIKEGRKNGLSQDIILKLAKQISKDLEYKEVSTLSGGDAALDKVLRNKVDKKTQDEKFDELVSDLIKYPDTLREYYSSRDFFNYLPEDDKIKLFDKVLSSISGNNKDDFIQRHIKYSKDEGLSQDIVLKLANNLSNCLVTFDVPKLSGTNEELHKILINKVNNDLENIRFNELLKKCERKSYCSEVIRTIKEYENLVNKLTENQIKKLLLTLDYNSTYTYEKLQFLVDRNLSKSAVLSIVSKFPAWLTMADVDRLSQGDKELYKALLIKLEQINYNQFVEIASNYKDDPGLIEVLLSKLTKINYEQFIDIAPKIDSKQIKILVKKLERINYEQFIDIASNYKHDTDLVNDVYYKLNLISFEEFLKMAHRTDEALIEYIIDRLPKITFDQFSEVSPQLKEQSIKILVKKIDKLTFDQFLLLARKYERDGSFMFMLLSKLTTITFEEFLALALEFSAKYYGIEKELAYKVNEEEIIGNYVNGVYQNDITEKLKQNRDKFDKLKYTKSLEEIFLKKLESYKKA